MSESIERRIIHKRIETLEERVRAEHRNWDALYENFSSNVDRKQVQDVVDKINGMYDEILILKRIIIDADYEVGLEDRRGPEHKLAKTQLSPGVYVWCTCGARFDAYGEKGAMNWLEDHIRFERTRG